MKLEQELCSSFRWQWGVTYAWELWVIELAVAIFLYSCDSECSLLWYDTVLCGTWVPVLQVNILAFTFKAEDWGSRVLQKVMFLLKYEASHFKRP
jgi:hypothetical protein